MIGFIKKALFGKTLSAIHAREMDLALWQDRLKKQESILKDYNFVLSEQAKENESKRVYLENDKELLEDSKKFVKSLESAFKTKLNNLDKDKVEFDKLKSEFYAKMEKSSLANEKRVLKLKNFKAELYDYHTQLEKQKAEVDALQEFLQTKIEQKDALEVNEMRTISLRGREVVIDKYGNFKAFA